MNKSFRLLRDALYVFLREGLHSKNSEAVWPAQRGAAKLLPCEHHEDT